MLTIAGSMRGIQLEEVEADAGSLSDLFFMKYRLEHYDVPPEFAASKTSACRVFDDDEGHRVAQITVPKSGCSFSSFRRAKPERSVSHQNFPAGDTSNRRAGPASCQVRNGVCFMAALRGEKKDLRLSGEA